MSTSLKGQYKSAVQQDIADSARGMMTRPNNVSHYQQLFQQNQAMPVFLKTKSDAFIYKNLMRASVVGLGLCAVAFGYMAAGKFKKS